ncbi:GGDEF domain-containing protein [Luteimonas sp. 50]|uniref:diguanylate cyclase n=1 Tax=Cognatiluteimonas sedimenti TaxID=2927791 RepID=A0ABT0A0M1_9GAMM|nr:GGDEF domain-containing protein [Lysobacter sedimenti]MCJ0824531.1 GGDEF domain-containing protein [Lysobacter sedimenti]
MHWLIAGLVYLGIALLLLAGARQGWISASAVAAWSGFVGLVVVAGYCALRSGWSERFTDPAMTMWQLSMGVIAVNWGYVICGPMRTSALFPLMVIFAFAAYSMRYRQIAWLTLFAVACLVGAVAIRQVFPHWLPVAEAVRPLQVDINNLLMILVVLPALALVAARLSELRSKLRDQRAALAKVLADVERMAVRDELTGLPNRRAMMDTLARSAIHARRGMLPFCVAMVDLEHFKQVNDTQGHAAGDAVLQRFAEVASRTLREGDVLGRWGGEEFLLVLPGATLASAKPVLSRMQSAIREALLPGLTITFSAGLAAYRDAEPVEALLARADDSLYLAKHAGRDRIESSLDRTPA